MSFLKRSEPYLGLRSVPMFADLPAEELAALDHHADQVTVASGTVISHQGRVVLELLVIEQGEATVSRDGRELARLGPGDVVGELALLDRAPSSATVTAVTDITAQVIPGNAFETLLDESPGFARKLLPMLARRLRAATVQLGADQVASADAAG